MQVLVPFVDHEIGYRLLQSLIVYHEARIIEIPTVITTEENSKSWWPSVREVCDKAGLPLLLYETLLNDTSVLEKIDYILLCSWKHILPDHLIKLPRRHTINLHYSLLPSYRGVYPINWAIINGESKTGFTYHVVSSQIDAGQILMQCEVKVNKSDTARTLQLRIDDEVVERFDEFLGHIVSDGLNIKSTEFPSNDFDRNERKYYSRDCFEKACFIDLSKNYSGLELFNLIRGLSFLKDSDNAYILDAETGKKVYLSITLRDGE